MAQQIIQQPNGRFALFSSIADGFILLNATAEDVVQHFMEEATRDVRRHVETHLGNVREGKPQDSYYQFTMTWKDAVKKHNETFPNDKVAP